MYRSKWKSLTFTRNYIKSQPILNLRQQRIGNVHYSVLCSMYPESERFRAFDMNGLGNFLIHGVHYKYVSESSHNDLPPPGKHFPYEFRVCSILTHQY